MKTLLCLSLMALSPYIYAESTWLKNLDSPDKQQQMDLRWQASGGQIDIKFMHRKLQAMRIQLSPPPQFPDKRWDANHLVFPISSNSNLDLQMPYGMIEKVTSGYLSVDSDFSLSSSDRTLKVNSFKLIPQNETKKRSDVVNFKLVDQNDQHLFNIYNIHIEYDKDQGLLKMSNMDLFATEQLESLLNIPGLADQVVGQLHSYNHLKIPDNAITSINGVGGLSCNNRPLWDDQVDVQLTDIGSVQWMRNIGPDQMVIAPSAELKNVGVADVPWHTKFTGPQPPFANDQHPYLSWAVYREVDNRYEQIGVSGVKHAFLTINFNCDLNCNDNHILWPGCEDVYGVGNNDSSFDLGPRHEIEAYTGVWDNCGSFFDPQPCSGSQQGFSNGTDENRLTAYIEDLTDAENQSLHMQAWYLVREDIDIFNSMGHRSINPTFNNGFWSMNAGNDFTNGAALDNYVPPNTMGAMQASQTIKTAEGQFTVAVKVVDLGGGLYRYNYAIENYDYDPRFINYHIPLSKSALLTDMVFVDPERNTSNDWQFNHQNGILSVAGNAQNEQDWGIMFSFSFTSDSPPTQMEMSLDAADTAIDPTVFASTLAPEEIFKSDF